MFRAPVVSGLDGIAPAFNTVKFFTPRGIPRDVKNITGGFISASPARAREISQLHFAICQTTIKKKLKIQSIYYMQKKNLIYLSKASILTAQMLVERRTVSQRNSPKIENFQQCLPKELTSSDVFYFCFPLYRSSVEPFYLFDTKAALKEKKKVQQQKSVMASASIEREINI